MKIKIGKPIPYNNNIDEMMKLWSEKITELSEGKRQMNLKNANFAQKKAKDFNILTRLYQYYALYILFLPIFATFFYKFKI